MSLRIKRGTDAERAAYTPEIGELLYITDTDKLWVGDGVTVGGLPIGATFAGDSDDITEGTINLFLTQAERDQIADSDELAIAYAVAL